LSRYVGPKTEFFPFLGELAPRLDRRMRFPDPPSAAQASMRQGQGNVTAAPSARFCLIDLIGMLPPNGVDQVLPLVAYLGWSKREVSLRFAGYPRRMRIITLLKHTRIYSSRFKQESAWVERWLHMIDRVRVKQPEAALAVIRSADLIKGSGLDYDCSLANWHAIIDRLVKPACDGALHLNNLGEAIKIAVNQAINDADSVSLDRVIAGIVGDLNSKPLSV
jgi:hypothetical protein